VRTPRCQALMKKLPSASLALFLASGSQAGHPVPAAPASDVIIDQSSGVMIYRGVSPRGTPVVVLTNLDEEGNRLPCPGADAAGSGLKTPLCGDEPQARVRPAPMDRERAPNAPPPPPPGQVKVVVKQSEGAAEVDARDVEVTADGSGATTVIININNSPATPERETVVVPAPLAYPIVAIGGLAGGFRYPDHLHFLGYGHDTSSPSWFGGLGLNAGNGFGLVTGTSCGHGFDCMFGPASPHP
jgi:hypothetical protein